MVIVITGPTAVGKTKLSIELAKKLNGEIINADSTQVFKGLDIATAKITEEEMNNIPHHLIDIKEITEDYTVFEYQKDCRDKIEEIKTKGKIPILVGGTGLYIKAALYDYQFAPKRKLVEDDFNYSNEALYQKLCEIDPKTNIHPNNRKRVIRALQYYQETKRPMSEHKKTDILLYPTVFIGLTTKRETLYEKINQRVDIMVKQGLIEEAKAIYDSNIRTKAVMTPIGYKELFQYFDHTITLEEAIDKIKQKSRNYAKKQYTWFRHQMNIKWFEVQLDHFNDTIKEVENYLESR